MASKISDNDYSWKGLNEKVVIEDDIWTGYGAIILSGVKNGMGSIVAARSLVTKDIEPFSIYGGFPASKIRNRFNNELDLAEHIRLYTINYKTK